MDMGAFQIESGSIQAYWSAGATRTVPTLLIYRDSLTEKKRPAQAAGRERR